MLLGTGPQTAPSIKTFSHKYCQRGESFRDVCNRVASALKDSEEHYHTFRSIMLSGRFWPGGRILSTIGTTKCTTPYNCFVSGPIRDAFVSGEGNIMQRAHEAATTMRLGGGIGYDFSTLRPRGDKVTKLDSTATGPVSFMGIYNEVGICTSSTGERRGAQMGVLRVDHPDIEEFIHAKQNEHKLNGFNLSIAITDEFMQAVADGEEFDLRFGGKTYRTIDAIMLWETIMRSTWDWAEPGVIFIDRINHWNNLKYCEQITTTNPCSEQPLPPFGACLLGYFNLTKYLRRKGLNPINEPLYNFDMMQFAMDIPSVVRAMDNVIDIATYPLPEQEDSARATRRMGLGVMGLANALEACGLPYGSAGFISYMEDILTVLKNEAYWASVMLAKEKGVFPQYSSRYLEGPFIRGLAGRVKDGIGEHGIRNSHITSIAPTGTTSFCADNVSSGIEPVFEYRAQRMVGGIDGPELMEVEDYGSAFLKVRGRTSDQVTAEEHVAVLCAAQKHIDSAISKTCNVPSGVGWEDFKKIYFDVWKRGGKSCSTFRKDGKRSGVMKKAVEVTDCANGMCAA